MNPEDRLLYRVKAAGSTLLFTFSFSLLFPEHRPEKRKAPRKSESFNLTPKINHYNNLLSKKSCSCAFQLKTQQIVKMLHFS